MGRGRSEVVEDVLKVVADAVGQNGESNTAIVVVHGEFGSGRTIVCDRLAAEHVPVVPLGRDSSTDDLTELLVDTRNENDGQPCLVIIDDADHFDAGQVAAVVGVASDRPDLVRAVVIAATDPGVLGIAPSDATWVELLPLSRQEIAEVVHEVTGSIPNDLTCRRIKDLSDGNMRTVVEIAGSLTLDQIRTGERIALELLDQLPQTRFVSSHMRVLPEETQRAVCLAALGYEVELSVLEQALRAIGGSIADFAPAEQASWIHISSEGVRFRHRLDRIAATHLIPYGARRELLVQLAQAVDSEGGEQGAWYEAQFAPTPDSSLAGRLDILARAELAAGCPLRASEAWQQCARFRGEENAPTLLLAAQASHAGGDLDRSLELAETVIAGGTSPNLEAEARRLQGAVLTWQGFPDEAYRSAHRQAETVSSNSPAQATSLLMQATVGALHSGHLEAAAELARRAAEMARPLGPFALAAQAASGHCIALLGDPTRLCDVAAASNLQHELEPFIERVPSGLILTSWVGRMLDESGYPDAALDMLSWTIDRARSMHSPTLELMPLAHRTAAHLRRARHVQAESDSARLSRLADEVGAREHRLTAEFLAGCVASRRGDSGAFEILHRVASMSSGPARLEAHVASGDAMLARGDAAEAVILLEQVEAGRTRMRLDHPGFSPHRAALVEALVRAGSAGRATEIASTEHARSHNWPDPLVQGLAARSMAMTATDPRVARQFFHESLECLDQAEARLEAARTLLCMGEQLARGRHRAAARDPLRSAMHRFERLGTPTWAQRARNELRLAGARDGAMSRGPLNGGASTEQLTSRELGITELVVTGATNREVASALHLSPKTIENHLSRIYAKLGVRSRTELASLLSDTP